MNLDEARGRLFLSVAEVAEIFDADERTIRRATQEGQIPAVKIGTKTMIPVPKLLALIEPSGVPQAAAQSAEQPAGDAVTAAVEIVRGALKALEALSGHQDEYHGGSSDAFVAGQGIDAGKQGVPPRLLRGGDGAA